MSSNRLRIATWNFQTDKAFPQWRADAFRLAMNEIGADVWVITEPLLSFSPGTDFRLVAHSCEAADIQKGTDARWAADRRWVAIWSKVPARKIEVFREPDRMTCVRVERNGLPEVVIVGTVLPWATDSKWPGKDGKGFCDALEYQACEWKRLWGTTPAAGFCIAGDFNQSLPYTPHFGPAPSATRLQLTLDSLGLKCLTGNASDPLPAIAGRPSIDHICIGGSLQSLLTPPSRTWKIPRRSEASADIADHFGAWVEFSVGESMDAEMNSDVNGSSASYWLEVFKTTETGDARWKEAVDALTSMGLLAVPALIEATGHDHPEVRRGASTARHRIGPAIIPFLMKALKHDNPLVRESAARGLYGFAPQAQKAIPALTDALKDSDAFVRQWVATALQNLAHHFGPVVKIAVPGLADLLKDDDYMVREWASHALGTIGEAAAAALPALEAALEDEEPSVKDAVADAIKRITKDRDQP
jgi:hypothetical protein